MAIMCESKILRQLIAKIDLLCCTVLQYYSMPQVCVCLMSGLGMVIGRRPNESDIIHHTETAPVPTYVACLFNRHH